MTLVTMSPGSNPKITFSRVAWAASVVNPLLCSRCASQGITLFGQHLAEPLAERVAGLMPLSSRRATRIWPSSGPRMNRMMLLIRRAGRPARRSPSRWPRSRPRPPPRITWRHLDQHLPGNLEVGARRGRNRSTNSPESTCGKSSVPSCGQATSSAARRVSRRTPSADQPATTGQSGLHARTNERGATDPR